MDSPSQQVPRLMGLESASSKSQLDRGCSSLNKGEESEGREKNRVKIMKTWQTPWSPLDARTWPSSVAWGQLEEILSAGLPENGQPKRQLVSQAHLH